MSTVPASRTPHSRPKLESSSGASDWRSASPIGASRLAKMNYMVLFLKPLGSKVPKHGVYMVALLESYAPYLGTVTGRVGK